MSEHIDDCGCTACQLRRLCEEQTEGIAELLAELKRLRNDLAKANDIRRRERSQRSRP